MTSKTLIYMRFAAVLPWLALAAAVPIRELELRGGGEGREEEGEGGSSHGAVQPTGSGSRGQCRGPRRLDGSACDHPDHG